MCKEDKVTWWKHFQLEGNGIEIIGDNVRQMFCQLCLPIVIAQNVETDCKIMVFWMYCCDLLGRITLKWRKQVAPKCWYVSTKV